MGLPVAAAVWKLGEFLITGKLKKAEKKEEVSEAEEKGKLDKLLDLTTRMERDVALIRHDLASQAGAVAEVKSRIDGVSKNHGERLAELEGDVRELKTLVQQLLDGQRNTRRRK